MMTHPGPPAGPPGKSLGLRNARLAKWDHDFEIWRFRTATTRYFLCKKQKIRGRLRPLRMGSGIAPLEQMISHALQQNRAYRGALGDLDSWHLHAWHHNEPFPKWAAFLVKAIESGKYPSLQRGNYDLRLDIDRDRREWEKIIRSLAEEKTEYTDIAKNVNAAAANNTLKKDVKLQITPNNLSGLNQDKISTSEDLLSSGGHVTVAKEAFADLSQIAVIIPVRDRSGQRLKNTLVSLNWQSIGRPMQIVVVSCGSNPLINKELSEICTDHATELITVGDPIDPWNKPYALNVGIQATKPEAPYLMTMDADMILAPNFLAVVLERLKRKPPAIVLCRSSDLPQKVCLPENGPNLMNEFAGLQRLTSLRPEWGPGGIQAVKRSFFFDIRGYDEDFVWWGAMDRDMVCRARLTGLVTEWIEDRTAMLHQWHPRKHSLLTKPDEILQAKRAWHDNHKLIRHRSKIITRNPVSWGCYVN
jgi:hypothetical protein